MNDGSQVLVANAGVHPELQHAAAAIRGAGHLSGYRTSLGWAADSRIARAGNAATILKPLQRRQLPESLSWRDVSLLASDLEVAYLAARLLKSRHASQILAKRAEEFDRRLARSLSKTRPDILLVQATGARESLQEAQRLGITTVLNCPIAHHRWMDRYLGVEAAENPDWAPLLQHVNEAPRWLTRLDEEIELADHLLVASSFTAGTFCAEGVEAERVMIVPLGSDVRVREKPVRANGDGPLTILFAGQLTQRKGLSYLVDAFRGADLPAGSRLVLAGSPVGDASRLRDIPGVELVGYLADGELSRQYLRADVFVLPSLAEGFGLVALEAMSHGVATIVSEHTFAGDVITHGLDGFVVPPRESALLRARLEELAAEPDLRNRLGEAGMNTAVSFTWADYGRRLVTALHQRALLR